LAAENRAAIEHDGSFHHKIICKPTMDQDKPIFLEKKCKKRHVISNKLTALKIYYAWHVLEVDAH
jgi:hypothetical protein